MERTKLFAEICALLLLERGEDGRSESMQICPPAKRFCQAYTILRSITAMNNFLMSRRSEYVHAAAPTLLPESRCISLDLERRRTDQLVEQFVRGTRAAIDALSEHRNDNLRSLQACEHRKNVRILLRDYLSGMCHMYAEMKAIYVKRVCDRHRWSRFGSPYRRLGPDSGGSSSGFVPAPLMKGLRQFHRISNAASKMVSVGSWFQSTDESEGQRESTSLDLSLTYDECVQFEEESKVLVDRLNSQQEAVRHIEMQLSDICYLQRLLTSHILEQEDNVERMAMATHLASAHLAAAARVLDDSVVRRTSCGYWAAGLIFWLSLVLLFLHWLTP